MKLINKIVSAAVAMAISIGNAAFSMPADAAAVNWDKVLENGPEWLPYNFGSAMYFHNNYGTTKAEGDMICIVYHVPDHFRMSADISSFKRADGAIADAEYEWNTYTFDFQIPETSDRSSRATLSEEGGTSRVGYHYEALMILNNCAKGFDIDISLEDKETGKTSDSVRYTFVNEDGELKETDIYGWLPDSVPEFNAYFDKNGNISLKDGLLIYCNTISYSSGTSLNVEQTGSGKLGLAVDSSVSRDNIFESTVVPDGMIKVYKGEAEGDVDITFTSGIEEAADGSDHMVSTASVHVDEDLNIAEKIKDIPDWIPQDYESAVKFINEHGASFVNDGIICFVRNEEPDRTDEYPVSFEGSVAQNIASYELINKVYADPENKYAAYNVRAYDIPNDSDLTVNFRYGRHEFEIRTINSYSFKKDSTGYITQTDKYSWLPDCHEEFNAYYEKHGTFSVQAGYVMYCTDVPTADTDYLITQQNGSGAFIEDHEEISAKQEVTAADSNYSDYSTPKHMIKLFKPVKPGTVKLIISKKINRGNGFTDEEDSAYFTITDDLEIIPAEKKDMKTTVKGDCNGDGILGISDLVSLKKWLLGKGSMAEYGIADVNGDGSVDVFDLVEMRNLLLNVVREEPRPVMVFISENYAWVAYQNVTVIDQYGSAYSFRPNDELTDDTYPRKDFLYMHADNWYDKLLDIIATNDRSAGYIPDSAMAEANKFAQKAESYTNAELSGMGYMCDAGSNSVYIIGTDSEGKPVNSKIATFGDFVGWIDDNDAKDFIKLLNSYNIYGGNIIDLLEYNKSLF